MAFQLFLFLPFQACAPRYVYHQHKPRIVERIEPVGTCFLAKNNFNEFHEFSPCRTSEFEKWFSVENEIWNWSGSMTSQFSPQSCEIQSIEGCARLKIARCSCVRLTHNRIFRPPLCARRRLLVKGKNCENAGNQKNLIDALMHWTIPI